MNPRLFALALAVLAAAWGCSASQPAPSKDENPGRESSGGPGKEKVSPSVPTNTQQGAEWDELIRRLKEQYAVSEQQKSAQADEHYKLAERHYQGGDFEKAELECQKALQLEPGHAAAHALMLEVQFVQGKGKATPQSEDMENIMRQAVVRHQQTILEIERAYSTGVRAFNLGEYDKAEREFRTILEYAKWMPTGVELETHRTQALSMLEKTKAAKKAKELDEAKVRGQIIEEEKMRDELKRLIEQKRELELLFGQAQLHFEREEYERCADICERILYVNPNLTSVAEMRMVAMRLRITKGARDSLRNYIEEWKRTFERVELNGVVQAKVMEFPDRAIWDEIRQRKPKGLADLEEDIDPADREIAEKLKQIRISLDYKDQPLPVVVDYVRDISGMNFLIDRKGPLEKPDEVLITIKIADIPLDGALKLMLSSKQLAHYVQGGVVIVTPADTLKKRVKLELYDVQDLTYGLQDFPGVDIALGTGGTIGTSAPTEEGQKVVFTGEDLAALIKKVVQPGGWDEADGKSAAYQNGLLIVRNTVDVHKKLRKFLSDLRKSTGILVNVEARFLSVEDTFLQQVGMDFRDVDRANFAGTAAGIVATPGANNPNPRVPFGVVNLGDINPVFTINPVFISPSGAAGGATTPGITFSKGNNVIQNMGARVQNIMQADFLVQRFYNTVLSPVGGATLQYTLLDAISVEMIMRLVSRSERSHVLTAPRITLFNTQRGNIRISNQFAYIKSYNIQIATAAVAPDPNPDVVSDGISLDVRPIVSADRKYITIEMRPTVATLFPPPPQVFSILINLAVPGNPVTPALPVLIETPILNVQRLRTTVVVPDRGTLLIGGLTTFFEEDAESSIPVWRNLPIVGNLGSEKVKGLQKKQLLVILSARIIIPDEEERRRFD